MGIAEFIELYSDGDGFEGLKCLFKDANTSLDDYVSGREESLIISYAATLMFESHTIQLTTNDSVASLLRGGKYDSFVEAMDFDLQMLNGIRRCEKNFGDIALYEFFSCLRAEGGSLEVEYTGSYAKTFCAFARLRRNLLSFIDCKRGFDRFIVDNNYSMFHHPYISVPYQNPIDVENLLETLSSNEGRVPVFIMEYLDLPWEEIGNRLNGKKVIFVFYDAQTLYRCLDNDYLAKMLMKHVIVVLNHYALEQLKIQGVNDDSLSDCYPIMLAPQQVLHNKIDDIIDLLTKCLKNIPQNLWEETEESNTLYRLGKQIAYMIKAEKIGPRRLMGIHVLEVGRESMESRRHLPPYSILSDWSLPDYLRGEYEKYKLQGARRSLNSSGRCRVAHLIPILFDWSSHAPSERLRSLLKYYDREQYDLAVIVSEQFRKRRYEYGVYTGMRLSYVYGFKTITSMVKHQDIEVYVEEDSDDYITAAINIVQFLSETDTDILICHEVHPIHELVAYMTDVPIRIFFDHGRVMPRRPCFDALIMSHNEEASRMSVDERMQVFGNPKIAGLGLEEKGSDSFRVELQQGYSVPKDAVLLGTISNHLESRLSVSMCMAVVEILRRCPQAYYFLVGGWFQEEKQRRIFRFYGVDERVVYLGIRDDVMTFLKAIDIYLNEFPFGGSSSVVESMAAGVPIVSMFVENGSHDCREGAYFFGVERAVKEGDTEGYIDLACRLIEDEKMRKEWSEIARQRYFKHYADPEAYARRHQEILHGLRFH